jgi:4'-phosphopantetheinyl transferase
MTDAWPPPPPGLTLSPAEVHVWRACLDLGPEGVRALEATLGPEDRARALRFRRAIDRVHFIVAHGALRAILARYVGRDPADLRLVADPKGKPRLAAPGPLRFNLSHSVGLALCAVARDAEVGVDIERVQPEFPVLAIAARFFAPAESTALRALPAAAQPRAFFDLWARKEASLKARGDGLARPLRGIDTAGLTLSTLAVGDDYAAAVAYTGGPRRLRCWEWSAFGGRLRSPADMSG